jgi:pyridoxamine 5'-phosphate oxidase
VTPMAPDVAAMRASYEQAGLSEADLAPTWPQQFRAWMADAVTAELREANAMVVATADTAAAPSARFVLLKGFDERGFAFYTNRESRKGRELAANPQAALVFPWYALQRQVTVRGGVEHVSEQETDAYWATRPWGSRIGAAASPQSTVVDAREELDARWDALAADYPEGTDVPRPDHWGGLRVVPETVEFWQGRKNRMHDRLRYRRDDSGAWVIERLAP